MNKISLYGLRRFLGAHALPLVIVAVGLFIVGQDSITARADPHPNQSVNVAVIGSRGVINGGTLPAPAGFTFTNLSPANVSTANLAPYDTAILNVASVQMNCTTASLPPPGKADLVTFVAAGGKLIIYDSECRAVDYSWLPFPFTTVNPGARGATGTLNIVEENVLSTTPPGSTHYINAVAMATQTDAVGDMNVMTTFDPNWCLDMSGTNVLNVTGPVHTYARFGTGLLIYNGLDADYMGSGGQPANTLDKTYLQELQAPFNPSPAADLPCGVAVVGIALTPVSDANPAGTNHTVTATLTDLVGNPQSGINVKFDILSGPNAQSGPTVATDAAGHASWTYSGAGGGGMDRIQACFTDGAGNVICSQIVTKLWRENCFSEVTWDPVPATFSTDTTPVPNGPSGTFTFDARMTNTGAWTLTNMASPVVTLSPNNLILNYPESPATVGATLTLPNTGGYSDGMLSPGEVADFQFVIGLDPKAPFSFFVDLYCVKGSDRIIDADGIASPLAGLPAARDPGLVVGAALASFPVTGATNAGVDWFDNDHDGQWTWGAGGDDLHSEDPSTCPTAIRDGFHDLGLDCKILDIDASLVNGQQVDCDLEVNAPFTPPHTTSGGCPSTLNNIRYHDADGDGSWDNGEDIVLDRNGDGIYN